ncbi:MAG TPA: PKD domain-containing protein [Candidatus Micrarchaeia archaeon]|nr:PKD domain-containing protein [Candidatus Micrarchaeia archaeon]
MSKHRGSPPSDARTLWRAVWRRPQRRGWVPALLGALLAVVAGAAPAAASGGAGWTFYVANAGSNTVTPIATASNTPGTPLAAGSEPAAVAINAAGTTLYVAADGSNTVIPIDLATGVSGSPIPVGSYPVGMALTPDGGTLYVTNAYSNTVTPIDLTTGTGGAPIPVGGEPFGITVSPTGSAAYVADFSGNSVTRIAIPADTPGPPIAVPAPVGLATTPDGSTMWIVSYSTGEVYPLATATNTVGPGIPTGSQPYSDAVSPNGRWLYVANYASNTVTPIQLPSAAASASIAMPAGCNPNTVVFTPDSTSAYITCWGNATVVPITVATGAVGAPIAVGANPADLVSNPDQAPVAAVTVTPAPMGQPSEFSAAGSTVAVGTIAQYAWSFGDGSSAVTLGPTTTHVYAAPGLYTATVTETSSGGTSTAPIYDGQTLTNNGGPSAVATATFVVEAVPAVTIGLTGAPLQSMVGQPVTYTASVSVPGSGGVVTFEAGGANLSGCLDVPVVDRTAVCHQTYVAAGTWSVSASYAATAGAGSAATSSPLTQAVASGGERITLQTSLDPAPVGRPVRYQATVIPDYPVPAPLLGTVTFAEGGAPILGCVAQPLVQDQAACTTTMARIGTRVVTANYSGAPQSAAQVGYLVETVGRSARAPRRPASAARWPQPRPEARPAW